MLPLEDGGVVDTKLKVRALDLSSLAWFRDVYRSTTRQTSESSTSPSSRFTSVLIHRVTIGHSSRLSLPVEQFVASATAYAIGELGKRTCMDALDVLEAHVHLCSGADIIKENVLGRH